jgi:PAS domain S-box-containing protein
MRPISLGTRNLFLLLSNLLNNTKYLFWVYDAFDNLVFSNANFLKVTGLSGSSIGKSLADISTERDIYTLIKSRLDAARNQDKILQLTDEIVNGNEHKYYESHWYNIRNECGSFVAGYAIDVTGIKKKNQEIKKLSSRLSYMSLTTTDAAWEWEAGKKHLHVSKRMAELTGYYAEVKYGSCSYWLSNVVHKDERIAFRRKLIMCIQTGKDRLETEYRILCKNGTMRFVSDKMYFVYQNKKLVRVFGSLKDITDKKTLELKISNYQKDKEKAVYAAAVQAQEVERDRISKELHDNVNQLMISSKIYMGIARQNPGVASEMLDKAIEYQLLAIEESRKLSHGISNPAIEFNGLKNIVSKITTTLKHSGLYVTTALKDKIIEELAPVQSTMVARILQELSSNILKYANASAVYIALEKKGDRFKFLLSDNGIGFNYNTESSGIGLTNIQNRVKALAGELIVITSPGEGCEVSIEFKAENPGLKLIPAA